MQRERFMHIARRIAMAFRHRMARKTTLADMGWLGFTLYVLLFQTCLVTGIGAVVVGAYLWNGIYIFVGLLLLQFAYRLHCGAMRLFNGE